MLEVFAVTVIQKQSVRVVLADPLHLLHVECALGFDPFPFSASWNRNRQTWRGGGKTYNEQKEARQKHGAACKHTIKHSKATPTGVVEQSLGFTAVLGGCDELPDETLDVLVSTIVKKAKDQDDSTDRLDVTFAQPAFTSGMGQYVPPTTPTGRRG